MKYLKLYENFDIDEVQVEEPIVLSDKTIDDVLGGNFFDDIEEDEDESYLDSKGIAHIKNWTIY